MSDTIKRPLKDIAPTGNMVSAESYHITGQIPVDDRGPVDTSTDLIDPSIWKADRETGTGANTWYAGMTVATRDGEFYQLVIDEATASYPTASNWKKVGSNPGTGREIKVNGVSKVGVSSTTALDVSAGSNVSLSYTDGKLVISSTDTDTNTVGINTGAATKANNVYLIGLEGTTAKANSQGAYLYDASIYINNGVLYENSKSFHESNEDDWGYIDATHK